MTPEPAPNYDGTEESWQAFQKWAFWNSNQWQNAVESAILLDLTEEQKYRMLAVTLQTALTTAQNALIRQALMSSPIFRIPTGDKSLKATL